MRYLPMKLLADTVESGFLKAFCAALAQVKMCCGLFPVMKKIIIEAITVSKIGSFSRRDHPKRKMDLFAGLLLDIDLLRCFSIL